MGLFRGDSKELHKDNGMRPGDEIVIVYRYDDKNLSIIIAKDANWKSKITLLTDSLTYYALSFHFKWVAYKNLLNKNYLPKGECSITKLCYHVHFVLENPQKTSSSIL